MVSFTNLSFTNSIVLFLNFFESNVYAASKFEIKAAAISEEQFESGEVHSKDLEIKSVPTDIPILGIYLDDSETQVVVLESPDN